LHISIEQLPVCFDRILSILVPSFFCVIDLDYKLNNFDASIEDCSHTLSNDSKNIDGLIYRAQCYLAKQQYDQAKQDLNDLLTIDPENNEAQVLFLFNIEEISKF
jgi:tetratricopeptide (TPR) repeat protein